MYSYNIIMKQIVILLRVFLLLNWIDLLYTSYMYKLPINLTKLSSFRIGQYHEYNKQLAI